MADKPKRKILPLVLIAVAVVIVVIGGIFFYISGIVSSITHIGPPPATGTIGLQTTLQAKGIGTYFNARYIAPYTVLKYAAANALNLTLTFGVYPTNPLPNVYYLNTTGYCYQCYNQQALFTNLSRDMATYGLFTNQSALIEVNESQLTTLPRNSMIIVDSGLIPIYLLPGTSFSLNGSTIINLTRRGDVVFYIGDNFSRSIGPDGVIFSSSNVTNSEMNFADLGTSVFLNKTAAVTKNQIKLNFSHPTFQLNSGSEYGEATYVNPVGGGSVIALSNTEAIGWGGTSALAGDMAKVINQHFWIKPIAINHYYISTPQFTNGTVGIIDFNTSVLYAQSSLPQNVIDGAYALVSAVARNSTSFAERNIPFRLVYAVNGTISMPQKVGQTQQTPISISIRNSTNQTQRISPSIQIYNSNLSLVEAISVGFFNTTNLSIIKYATFSLPSGSYIAVMRDFSNRYYGTAIFNVTPLIITPLGLNFKGDVFSFKLTSNGQAVTGAPYSITLNGGYAYNGTVGTNGTINYTVPKGTVLEYGNENFNITIFDTKYSYTTSNIQQVFHVPAIDIEIVIVALSMLILNLILKPPNRDEYYIDVPDFPPVQKVNVKVGKAEITSVFDKVNYNYHWRYMPLTVEEMKSGISSNVRYNNIPVSITLQNTSMIVNKLIGEGEVITAGGYFAPKRWATDSGHDIEYLAVFRKLRDYCVAHAILFTDVGVSDTSDVVLSKGGAEAQVMIYSSASGLREMKILPNTKMFVIFLDEETKLTFMQKLYDSYGESAEVFKMGISYGYIKLLDANDLSQLIF